MVNCNWIMKGCMKINLHLALPRLVNASINLQDTPHAPQPNGKKLALIGCYAKMRNICTVYIWWILQWPTRYSLLMQPQPDERTLLLLAVVCRDETYYKYMYRIYIDEYFNELQWTRISSLLMQLMVITRFENVFLLGCSLQQWEINLYACIKLALIYRWYISGL